MSESPVAARWLRYQASASTSNGLGGRWRCRTAICDNARIGSTGWRASVATLEGNQHTYPWIEEQVRKVRVGKQS